MILKTYQSWVLFIISVGSTVKTGKKVWQHLFNPYSILSVGIFQWTRSVLWQFLTLLLARNARSEVRICHGTCIDLQLLNDQTWSCQLVLDIDIISWVSLINWKWEWCKIYLFDCFDYFVFGTLIHCDCVTPYEVMELDHLQIRCQ